MKRQMSKERREAYVEVLEILNHMDKKYVEKIPLELINFFKDNSSREYKFYLDDTIPFEEQNLKENTINILAMLNLNYWCESEEHKKNLLKKYYDNEMEYQKRLMEKYNTDNLFKRERKSISVPKRENVQNFPQNYEEPKWYVLIYESVYEFVSKFIRKLFN